MNWFATQRQAWIGEMLSVYGFINRHHVQRKFGVSHAQAALDFRAFNDANPTAMQYDLRKKTYYATASDDENQQRVKTPHPTTTE